MTDSPNRIVIAGAGGMGALFGAILQEGGLTVTLLDVNRTHVDAIRRDGLAIEGFGGARTVRIPATADADELEEADAILVQCKAHATRAVARSVKHLVDRGAVCISFQNGLGNEEVLAEELGETAVLGGVTTMAAMMLGPGRVQDFARVPSAIGEMGGGVSERAVRIAETLTRAGLETTASADIRRDIWKKLLGNIAMSAVSGTTNLTSAQALAIPDLKTTSLRALDEALAVARIQGIDLDRETAVAGMETISKPGGTGDNKSSLCVDILNRRPSEVEVIYGSVIALAHETGVAVPTLETLRAIVKGIESHYVGGGS
jgi:2-dehydropantoate 2-reductase